MSWYRLVFLLLSDLNILFFFLFIGFIKISNEGSFLILVIPSSFLFFLILFPFINSVFIFEIEIIFILFDCRYSTFFLCLCISNDCFFDSIRKVWIISTKNIISIKTYSFVFLSSLLILLGLSVAILGFNFVPFVPAKYKGWKEVNSSGLALEGLEDLLCLFLSLLLSPLSSLSLLWDFLDLSLS